MVKRYGPSKYKYVIKVNRDRNGRKVDIWRAFISNYRSGKHWSMDCDTEKQAAIEVDKAFIRIGKDPVNTIRLFQHFKKSRIMKTEVIKTADEWLEETGNSGFEITPCLMEIFARKCAIDFMMEHDEGLPRESWEKIYDDRQQKQEE